MTPKPTKRTVKANKSFYGYTHKDNFIRSDRLHYGEAIVFDGVYCDRNYVRVRVTPATPPKKGKKAIEAAREEAYALGRSDEAEGCETHSMKAVEAERTRLRGELNELRSYMSGRGDMLERSQVLTLLEPTSDDRCPHGVHGNDCRKCFPTPKTSCCPKCWKNLPHPKECSCNGEGVYPALCVDASCECHQVGHTQPSSKEDKNGHRIDADGKLVFDERCHGCDAPTPEKKEWEKELDEMREDHGYNLVSHDHYKNFISRLLSQTRKETLEEVKGVVEGMKKDRWGYDEGNINERPIRDAALDAVLTALGSPLAKTPSHG